MNRKGFTLVEVMIVVAILGLLAAIAIPNFMVAKFKTETGIRDNKYATYLMEKAHYDIKKAKLLIGREEMPEPEQSDSKDNLICPKCKYVFGHYKLVEI